MNGHLKNKVFNIAMAVVIAAIIGVGIVIVGMTRGWFKKADPNAIVLSDLVGAVQMERGGVGYSAENGVTLQQGDILGTKPNAAVTVSAGGNTFALNENSEIKVTKFADGISSFEVTKGEMFAVVNDASKLESISFQGKALKVKGTVFAISVQSGSAGVTCLEGKVDVGGQSVEAGKVLSYSGDQAQLVALSATALNDFMLKQSITASQDRTLCFAKTDLEKVVADRKAEIEAQKAASGDKDAVIGAAEADGSGSGGGQSSGKSGGKSGGQSGSGSGGLYCTVEIRCDTILDNLENLTEGKDAYVPENGVILATSKVMFEDGETAYDVLKRVCRYADIQIEASWTPMYESYYVEGINHLYEFDCGNESGWMYKVNGWFPNYGCSSYTMKDGDSMVWCYTCNGLGADVGGGMY